jgi:hypothetical protein
MMMIKILRDLHNRNILVPLDLLAIAANICGFNVRIMTLKNNTLNLSLSLAILTLYIFNSEMIDNDDVKTALYKNIFNFIKNRVISINTLIIDKVIIFIKHCRLSVSDLFTTSIYIKGIL